MKTLILVLCLLTIGTVTASALDTPSAKAGGFAIELNLEKKATSFVAGKPVMVHYQMNAPNNRSIGFLPGYWNTAWYEVSVRDSQGKLVTAFKDSRPSSRGGMRIEDYPDTIPCRQKTEGLINLSRLLDLSKPGGYVVTFHIKMHYILFDGWRDYLGDEGYDRLQHEPLVYDTEVKLPFSLTEPNPADLLQLAISLRDKIINAPNAWAAEQLADELFTLPEAVAYPQGRHLVAQGVFAPAVAKALARTHNKSAVDLLVLLGKLPKPVSAQFGEWHIAGLLRELRGVAEPELRQYIDDALAKNEKRFQPGVLVTD